MGTGSVSRGSAGDYTSILRDYKVPVIPGTALKKLQAQNILAQAKAIADMKKDKILQRYQYFVGSSRNLYGAENAEGTLIQEF
ncbi:MAG: hypothetical protein NC517_11320 [Firmicutes bacterium]|nr:hypothetical protein [Bacillota bacterium]